MIISGNVVVVSGQPVSVSGQPANVSGNVVYHQLTDDIYTGSWTTVTGASGGTQLTTASGFSFMVQNLPTNVGNMYVGGEGTDSPNVAQGIVLTPGSSVVIDTNNLNHIRVYATTSGEKVATLGDRVM